MHFTRRSLAAAALSLLALLAGGVQARAGGIGFRNDLKIPVLVQGASKVNGMVRFGAPILVPPFKATGKTAWDNKLPAGTRYILIRDANQPNLIYLRNYPVDFQGNDLFFSIRLVGPNQIGLEKAEPVPMP